MPSGGAIWLHWKFVQYMLACKASLCGCLFVTIWIALLTSAFIETRVCYLEHFRQAVLGNIGQAILGSTFHMRDQRFSLSTREQKYLQPICQLAVNSFVTNSDWSLTFFSAPLTRQPNISASKKFLFWNNWRTKVTKGFVLERKPTRWKINLLYRKGIAKLCAKVVQPLH